MSAVIPNPAAGHAGHHDHAHDHPHGWRRWLFATNHKDIGTMYLWFSMTMFFIGGILALGIRAELFQPGLQFWKPEFFNQLTTMHGVIMVFGAIMPAFVGLRELDDPAADRRARHGVRADEQLQLLAAAARRAADRRVVLRAGRRHRRGLDALRAADGADGPGHGPRDLRAAHHGRQLDHGFDQHHHHGAQHARAGHDADEDADVRLDLADHRLPADRRDAGARGRHHDDADRPPLRHELLQRGRRRRPGDVPARVLVLRASRGVHHDPAGVRHRLADHPGVRAQAAVRLCVDGLRDGLDRHPVVHRLGAPHVHDRHAGRPGSSSSCTRRC